MSSIKANPSSINLKKTSEPSFLIIDVEILDKLNPYALKIYTQFRKLVSFTAKCDDIEITIPNLSKLTGISERKIYQVLNELEYEHFIIERINYKNFRYGKVNCFNIAQTYGYFRAVQNFTTPAPNAVTPAQNADLKEDHKLFQNKPPIIPQGDEKCFNDFWALYPVHEAKVSCLKIWSKEKLDEKADEIIAKLQQQIKEDDKFLKGYIPNPSKYLKEKRWEDDIKQPLNKSPVPNMEVISAQQQAFEEAQDKQYVERIKSYQLSSKPKQASHGKPVKLKELLTGKGFSIDANQETMPKLPF